MFFALAVLLIQPQVTCADGLPRREEFATHSADEFFARKASSLSAKFLCHRRLPFQSYRFQPPGVSDSTDLPTRSRAGPCERPNANAFLRSGKPMTVSIGQLVDESATKTNLWMGLGIATHSAATFERLDGRDAPSRLAGAQELNPLLKHLRGGTLRSTRRFRWVPDDGLRRQKDAVQQA